MPTFEGLPREIRDDIYCLLLRQPHDDVIPALAYVRRKYSTVSSLHPAILGVNRQIHAEAASILYGANQFGFLNGIEVDDLKRWFEKVGSENLQRIRTATVILVPFCHSHLTHQQIHGINKTFSKCLRMFALGCSKLQDLAVAENWVGQRPHMAASDHVLALSRVVPLRRLNLVNWVSLETADHVVRLLGLKGRSEPRLGITWTDGKGNSVED
ncbi:MAG: hypothetical protein M1830_007078, partial [Pleopsidium flavum]